MADLISEIVTGRLNKIKQGQTTPNEFLSQFGDRVSTPAQTQNTASNFIGGFNQGMDNLAAIYNAPEQRKEAARQEQMAAEQLLFNRGKDAEQQAYNRTQDAAQLAMQGRGEDRADTRLSFDQNKEARAVKQQNEADTLRAAQLNMFNYADQLGGQLNALKTKQKDTVKEGIAGKWLSQNDKGEFTFTGSTPEQQAAFNSIKDTELAERSLIAELEGRARETRTNNIKGDEILDTSAFRQQLTGRGNTDLAPTQIQAEQFAAANAALDTQEQEALRQTVGIIAGNPALQQIQSDLSFINNDFNKMDTDIIGQAIKNNIGVEDKAEAKREINSWLELAKKGEFDTAGSKFSELAKGNGKEFQYYVSKAIQNAGGANTFSTKWGDFENTALVKEVLAAQNAVDQVRQVNKKQEEIKTGAARQRLLNEKMYNAQIKGNIMTAPKK